MLKLFKYFDLFLLYCFIDFRMLCFSKQKKEVLVLFGKIQPIVKKAKEIRRTRLIVSLQESFKMDQFRFKCL